MNTFDSGLGGLGAAIVLALAVCYPKARSLSYSMFEQWGTRKDKAKSQLADLSLQTMYALQADLNLALGELAGGDELRFQVDPTRFRPAVLGAARFFELSQTIDTVYSRGRRCADLVPRGLEATVATTVLFFIRVSWRHRWSSWTFPVAGFLLAAVGALLLLTYFNFLYFQGKLQSAVIAAEDGQA